jgi:predicted ester cyclase
MVQGYTNRYTLGISDISQPGSIHKEKQMHDEELKAIVRRAHEAINQKEVELLDGQPAYWQTQQVFPMLFNAFPDLTSTVEQQTVDGEWVTTRATMRGTHLGAFMGVEPTGKAMEIMHIGLDQVVQGQVVEHFGVSDWLRALITFEVVSAPSALTGTAQS